MAFKILFLCLPLAIWSLPGYYLPWGKDADLCSLPPSLLTSEPLSPLGEAMEKLIWFHQNIISPVDGPRSHYKPSSSNYMLQAIQKHGFFKGYIMGCDRLLRENEEAWVYRTTIIDGKVWKVDTP